MMQTIQLTAEQEAWDRWWQATKDLQEMEQRHARERAIAAEITTRLLVEAQQESMQRMLASFTGTERDK